MQLVSVILLTKNRLEFLKKALASILSQTYSELEVIVVNDGSTDDTPIFLAQATTADKRIKVITHLESAGIIKSRQEALEKASGEFVAFLDDDDEWVDLDKLTKQVAYLNTHPSAVLVGSWMQSTYGGNQVTMRRPCARWWIRCTMLFRNNFFTSTVCARRQAVLHAGGFREDAIDLAEDYDLWLRLGLQGELVNLPLIFTRYRIPEYTKEKHALFLTKQLALVHVCAAVYPWARLAAWVLRRRLSR
jgi:glycosyltransferase involved in cell wall biosynthesis